MRRTRLSLAALVVASSAVLGLPTAALADDAAPAPAVAQPDAGAVPADQPAADGPAAEAPAADVPAAESAPAPATDGAPAAAAEPAPEVAEPAAAEAPVAAAAAGDVVQLVTMNDFHGRISPQSGGDGTLITDPGPDGAYGTADDVSQTVGGAANIATTLAGLRTDFGGPAESSFFVGAGDLVSASPFNSSVFKDEPTIEVLNALGLDFSSVGNHEFDRGIDELKRISGATDAYEAAHGGAVTACQGVTAEDDGCFTDSTGHPFAGADFPYLAANVVDTASGEPVLPPYEVVTDAAGNRIGLIGVVTDDTPNIVSPDGVAGLTFGDEAAAVNRYVPAVEAAGAEAIVVMIHEGGTQEAGNGLTSCGLAPDSPILAINAAIDAEVDAIVSAHTHVPYDCTLPDPAGQPRLVTQAGFYGKALTDVRLTLGADGDVDRALSTATNVPVLRTAPDPAVQAVVDYWDGRAAEEGSVGVGSQTADLDRAYRGGTAVRDAESGLGNLVADAQLAYARSVPSLGGDDVDVAFMNPGGLRADINCASSGPADPDGNVTFAETFAVQPFSNTVNTVDLTGAGIEQVLEQQWATRSGSNAMLHLSVAGLTYEFDARRAVGDRVDPASVRIGGQPLDLAATYRVAANSFLIAGGDSFAAFVSGRPSGAAVVTGANDVDAFDDYVRAHSPVSPPALDRAVSLDPANSWDDDGSGTGTCNPSAGGSGGGGQTGGGDQTGGGAGQPDAAAPVQGVVPVAGPAPAAAPVAARVAGGWDGDRLAHTGVPAAQLLGAGGVLVAAGVVLTAAGYRRRRGLPE
ncbi:bifunctional metallophosphatase/5'-nucleotidase [Modestobacter sp. NPDC049651]|uniref:bifunctional metallophosphatase/5'-nucleotidase n=1 Tax=unclassified Modestobacter TaxID=2643866 RepID=UPI0034019A89